MCLWASQSGGSFPGIANFALLLSSYPAEEVLPLDQLYTALLSAVTVFLSPLDLCCLAGSNADQTRGFHSGSV